VTIVETQRGPHKTDRGGECTSEEKRLKKQDHNYQQTIMDPPPNKVRTGANKGGGANNLVDIFKARGKCRSIGAKNGPKGNRDMGVFAERERQFGAWGDFTGGRRNPRLPKGERNKACCKGGLRKQGKGGSKEERKWGRRKTSTVRIPVRELL